jgi:colanic acid biosynthesis protein WcaH
MRLSAAEFGTVIRCTPLVAIDLVVRDRAGRVLVGMRRNRPAQGFYFAPGGRIYKDEVLDRAFERITGAELGTRLARDQASLLGLWDHIYPDNALGEPGYGTHYVVLAHTLDVDADALALPADQHADYLWLDVPALLARTDVHDNTKAYFRRR